MKEKDIKKLVTKIHKENDMKTTILALLYAFDLGEKKGRRDREKELLNN